MNRILLSIAILAITFVANANAICHHRAMQMQFAAVRVAQPYFVAPAYIPAPAPVYHQYQTIGGPAPTMVFDSAPVYGQPVMEAAPVYQQVEQVQVQQVAAPVAVQAAPVQTVQVQAAPVQTVQVQAVPVEAVTTVAPAVETIPVEATHSVTEITEAPIAAETTVAVEAVQTVQVQAAPVQTMQVPVQTIQVAAPAPQTTFVQTPPAARANVIETSYQPQTMYFQPAPVMMMIQPAPARGGCMGCLHR